MVNMIYELSRNKDFHNDWDLKSQVRKSAVSVMANIAEGFHRFSNKDFMRFLDYSRASLAETLSHCYVAMDQKYIKDKELDKIKEQSELIGKKLNGLINYLCTKTV